MTSKTYNLNFIYPLLIFSIAITLRLTHLFQVSCEDWYFKILLSDSYVFVKNAFEILSGQFVGHRVFYQDPLYVMFLAGIFKINNGVLFDVVILQIFFSSITSVIIYLTTSNLFNKKAGLFSGLLFSFYPVGIYYDALILKPCLIIFLLSLYIFSLVINSKKKSFVLSSIFLGLLCLIRGNFLLIIPIHFIWIYKNSFKINALLFSFLSISTIILPFSYMNYIASNDFILITSQAGQNFYTGNYPYNTTGYYIPLPFVRPSALYEEKDFHTEAEKRTGKKMLPSEVSKFWFKEAFVVIYKNPLTSLKTWGKRILIFFDKYEVPDNYDYQAIKKLSFIKFISFINFPLIVSLALIGFYYSSKQPVEKYIGIFVFLYFISLVLFFIFGRYRIPLIVPLCIFAGNGCIILINNKRLLIILLLMITLFSWNPIRLTVNPNRMYSYIEKRIDKKIEKF